MSSESGALVESKSFALTSKGQDKQMGRSQLPPNESVETEAIQRFLSICLKQFFICSQDGSEESSSPTDSAKENEMLSEELFRLNSEDITCRFCKDAMLPVTLALKSHLDACPLYPVECPNMCGEMAVPREKLTNHIKENCPNKQENCPHKDLGCSYQGPKGDMQKHLQEKTGYHLEMALEIIKEQKTELGIQRGRLRKQEENVAQLKDSVTKLTAMFEETVKKNAEQEKAINRLSEQMKDQKKHQSKHEKELKNRITELENSGSEIAPQNALFRYPGLNGYGELVWRISSFPRRLQRVQSGRGDDPMTSEPFYTSAFGYKIAVWAYINGRGKEEGICLSLYACVMSGEYDATLHWPIRPRYTFSLLDQNPDFEARKDLTRVRKVHDIKRDDTRRKGIDRPGRDERAIIVGFDDFIKHEELEAGNFLLEDSLFVRVLVDISD